MPRRRAASHREDLPPAYTPPVLPPEPEEPETPHPEVTTSTSSNYETREVTIPGIDDGPRWIAYGKQRYSPKWHWSYYHAPTDDLWCVFEFGAGEFDGLIDITFADGRPVPPSGVAYDWQYWWYPGTAAGQVDPNLQAVVPSWNEAFAGTCYAVVVLRRFGQYWRAQLPELVWQMRTRKCLMADTGLYVYSENGWDQWYDYERWSEGKGLPTTRVNAASFLAAKAADTAAGRKAESHLMLRDDTSPDDVVKTFELMLKAYRFWDSNQVRVVADRPGSSVGTYDDSVVSASAETEISRLDPLDRPDKITIFYTAITQATLPGGGFGPVIWEEKPYSYPEVDPPGTIKEEVFHIPHLHDPGQVKSLALYLYNKRVFDVRLSERWLPSMEARQLGDIVTRSVESRGLLITGRLIRRQKSLEGFDVTIVQHDNSLHSEFAITESPKIASTLPDVTTPPQPPGEFFLVGGLFNDDVYFDPPPAARPPITIPAGNWSGLNLTTLVTAAIGDGNVSATAVNFGAAGTTRALMVDVGAGVTPREFKMTLETGLPDDYTGSPLLSTLGLSFFYSDTGVAGPWTQIDNKGAGFTDNTFRYFVWQIPAALGTKRYFKWETSLGLTSNITEIQTCSFSGTLPYLDGYVMTKFIGRDPGNVHQFAQERLTVQPTASRPVSRNRLTVTIRNVDPWNGGYSSGVVIGAAFVQTISPTGVLSEGRLMKVSTFGFAAQPANLQGVPQNWQPVGMETISTTGTVNNLVLRADTRILKYTGDATLTITGIDGGWTGRDLIILNSGPSAVTLSHANASSDANNQFRFDVSLGHVAAPGQALVIFYDGTNWRNEQPVIRYSAGRMAIGDIAPGDGPLSARRDLSSEQVVRVQNFDAGAAAHMALRVITHALATSKLEFTDNDAYRAAIYARANDDLEFYAGGTPGSSTLRIRANAGGTTFFADTFRNGAETGEIGGLTDTGLKAEYEQFKHRRATAPSSITLATSATGFGDVNVLAFVASLPTVHGFRWVLEATNPAANCEAYRAYTTNG